MRSCAGTQARGTSGARLSVPVHGHRILSSEQLFMADPKYQALVEPFQSQQEDVSLLEVLDHVLHAGVVIQGSVVISIAGVDLIYVGLNAVLTSVETALKYIRADQERQKRD